MVRRRDRVSVWFVVVVVIVVIVFSLEVMVWGLRPKALAKASEMHNDAFEREVGKNFGTKTRQVTLDQKNFNPFHELPEITRQRKIARTAKKLS